MIESQILINVQELVLIQAVLWKTAYRYYTDNFEQFCAKGRKDIFIKQSDFNAPSIQTQSKNVTDFKFNIIIELCY